jgi:uncharacterized protein YrrD
VHRITEFVGKPIVSVDTGDRLGSVSDALLDDATSAMVAVIVSDGMFGKERVLPFRDIQTLGGDTVLARTQEHVVGPGEWRRSGIKATRSSRLRGKPVVTTGGERLGTVSDLLIDERTGTFDGVEVAEHHLAGLRSRRAVVRASDQVRIGRDAVIVPDAAREQMSDRDERRENAR